MQLKLNVGRKEKFMFREGNLSFSKRKLSDQELTRTSKIEPDPQKGSKRKTPEDELRRGRKTNKQSIAEVGVNLIESG